jgi:phospholipid-binding lipoprotein MlaA
MSHLFPFPRTRRSELPLLVKRSIFLILAFLFCLSGCAVSGKRAAAKSGAVASAGTAGDFAEVPVQKVSDPLERFNRTMFRFNDGLYTHVLRPVAHGYVLIVPRPVRTGVSNFFDNLQFPVRFINCALQGKITRSAQETWKFVFNSTAGIGGLIRVSDHLQDLADVPAEDFGLTLGVWGIAPGPYIVVPVLGPSDCRDAVGFAGDYVMSPLSWYSLGFIHHRFIGDAVSIALSGTRYVNGLPKAMDQYDQMKAAAVDPYIATRDAFLSYRAAQVRK